MNRVDTVDPIVDLVDVDLDVDLVDVDLDDQKYEFCLSRTDLNIVDGLNRNIGTFPPNKADGSSIRDMICSWLAGLGCYSVFVGEQLTPNQGRTVSFRVVSF